MLFKNLMVASSLKMKAACSSETLDIQYNSMLQEMQSYLYIKIPTRHELIYTHVSVSHGIHEVVSNWEISYFFNHTELALQYIIFPNRKLEQKYSNIFIGMINLPQYFISKNFSCSQTEILTVRRLKYV
jgi:hypothetical protein